MTARQGQMMSHTGLGTPRTRPTDRAEVFLTRGKLDPNAFNYDKIS